MARLQAQSAHWCDYFGPVAMPTNVTSQKLRGRISLFTLLNFWVDTPCPNQTKIFQDDAPQNNAAVPSPPATAAVAAPLDPTVDICAATTSVHPNFEGGSNDLMKLWAQGIKVDNYNKSVVKNFGASSCWACCFWEVNQNSNFHPPFFKLNKFRVFSFLPCILHQYCHPRNKQIINWR